LTTGSAPVNTVAPVASGSSNVLGNLLRCTSGTWSNSPTSPYAYAWSRNGTPIAGATYSTYLTVSADASASITCTVTATNASGSGTATSNAAAAALTPQQIASVSNYLRAQRLAPPAGLFTQNYVPLQVLDAAVQAVQQLSDSTAVDAPSAVSTYPRDSFTLIVIPGYALDNIAMDRDALRCAALVWLTRLSIATAQQLANVPADRPQVWVDVEPYRSGQPLTQMPASAGLDAVSLNLTTVAAIVTAGW
jgi:hypothetical protein